MIGATGLIGRQLAPLLVGDGHDLLLLSRRPTGVGGASELIGSMEQWPALLAKESLDIAISTLGTTWKKAGSWSAFEAVDRTAVVDFAQAAKGTGARQMISVSSVGADPGARNRYLALKGQVEADLGAIGFDRLDIVRPGLLVGERGAERRVAERVGIRLSPLINPLLRGSLGRYRAIDSATVAGAMAALVGARGNGTHIQFNRDIERLVS